LQFASVLSDIERPPVPGFSYPASFPSSLPLPSNSSRKLNEQLQGLCIFLNPSLASLPFLFAIPLRRGQPGNLLRNRRMNQVSFFWFIGGGSPTGGASLNLPPPALRLEFEIHFSPLLWRTDVFAQGVPSQTRKYILFVIWATTFFGRHSVPKIFFRKIICFVVPRFVASLLRFHDSASLPHTLFHSAPLLPRNRYGHIPITRRSVFRFCFSILVYVLTAAATVKSLFPSDQNPAGAVKKFLWVTASLDFSVPAVKLFQYRDCLQGTCRGLLFLIRF